MTASIDEIADVPLIPCKFQLDMTGSDVLVYSKCREAIFAVISGESAASIIQVLDLKAYQKRHAEAGLMSTFGDSVQLVIGAPLPPQNW